MAMLRQSEEKNITPHAILGVIILVNAEDLVHIFGDTIIITLSKGIIIT